MTSLRQPKYFGHNRPKEHRRARIQHQEGTKLQGRRSDSWPRHWDERFDSSRLQAGHVHHAGGFDQGHRPRCIGEHRQSSDQGQQRRVCAHAKAGSCRWHQRTADDERCDTFAQGCGCVLRQWRRSPRTWREGVRHRRRSDQRCNPHRQQLQRRQCGRQYHGQRAAAQRYVQLFLSSSYANTSTPSASCSRGAGCAVHATVNPCNYPRNPCAVRNGDTAGNTASSGQAG